MKNKLKIKFMLEFGCIPIWVKNGDELIRVGLPEELSHNQELVKLLDEIKDEYESLFINNDIEFSYRGFLSEKEEQIFDAKILKAINLLKIEAKDNYIIEVDDRL